MSCYHTHVQKQSHKIPSTSYLMKSNSEPPPPRCLQVFVRVPQTVQAGAEVLSGVVVANMTNWRHVYGNCSLKLQMARHTINKLPETFSTIHEEFVEDVSKISS